MSSDQELLAEQGRGGETGQDSDTQTPLKEADEGNNGPASDDDIIELVDVVSKGMVAPQTVRDEQAAAIPDPGRLSEGEKAALETVDDDLEDISLHLEQTAEPDIEWDQKQNSAISDEQDDRFDSNDFDFETPEDWVESEDEALSQIPQEELDNVMAGLADEVQSPVPEPVTEETAMAPEVPAISPERLEAVVTQAVQEVVERAVRETVAEVAERVIREAIESLKQSLETRPE